MCIRLRVWSPFPQAGRGKAEPSRAAQLVVLQPQAEGSWLPWPIPAHLQQLVVQRVYSVALDGCLALPLPGFVRQEVSLHIPEGRSRRSSSPHGQLQTSHSPKTATYSSHLFPCPQPVPPRFLPPFPSQHSLFLNTNTNWGSASGSASASTISDIRDYKIPVALLHEG